MTLKVLLHVSPISHNYSELKNYDKTCHHIGKSYSDIGRVNAPWSGFWITKERQRYTVDIHESDKTDAKIKITNEAEASRSFYWTTDVYNRSNDKLREAAIGFTIAIFNEVNIW